MANIPQWKVGDILSASKLNDMVDAINGLLAGQTGNNDAYITLDELNNILKQYSDVGHTHSVKEIADLVLPTKLSQLQNDTSYATEVYVNNAIADAKLNDGEGESVNLEGYAKTEDIPTKLSQLENDKNFTVQPNFAYRINMIASTEQPSVITSGVYPNLVITFNIPQGTTSSEGDEPQVAEKAIYYGRLSFSEVGGSVIQYNEITDTMIKSGANITKITPQILGKTSMGKESTTAEGDYIVVLVPDNEGYIVTKDNGIGGKVSFYKETAGATGEVKLSIDGNEYAMYGEILLSPAEIFIYIDKN